MKKFISLLIAAIIVCTCFVTAFATTYDASKVNVVTAPQVGDKVNDINADLTIQSFFFNGTEDQKAVVGRIFEGAEKEYIKWTKSGSSTPMESAATFTTGEYTVEVYYSLPSTLNYVESTVYSINGTTVTPNIADGMLKVSGKVTVSATEEDNAFAVTGIHLPTKAELDTLSGSIRNYSLTYWKAMEGKSHDYAPYVDNSGSIRTSLADKLRAVRPVIELKNVAKSNHKVGEKFTFGGKNFVIISETAAFCLTDIAAEQVYDGSMYIPDKFEDTAISRFINEFYAKNIGEGYKFITVEEKDDTYTLSFDTAGIKTIEAVKLAKDAAIALPDAKVTGYKFNGWFTDKEYKTKFVATKMPAEDITIYASYTKLYKLSFNTQDLKKIDAMWLEEGAAIVLPSADVENYKFMGWFTDAKYQKAIEKDAKMPKADTVLYGCYAIKLSKLGTILKDIDIEQFVKDSKLSPETFNKLAKSLGFEVKCGVNGKTYTVNDVVNFKDELTAQLKKDIKFGDIAAVDITISLGKDDGENMAIYVYNDIEDKEADKPTTTTKDTTKDNTDSKTPSDEKTTDIPDTGAESIAPAVITFLTSMATVGGAVVLKKKKEN